MAVWEGFACKLAEFWTTGGLCDACPLRALVSLSPEVEGEGLYIRHLSIASWVVNALLP